MSNLSDAEQIAIRPLDARSLALSVLLGSHPPRLPARALVALAELFGIAGGTMRTALSRMVASGELELGDGRYQLGGRLLERQRAQDAGRQSSRSPWEGAWHTIIAAADQRHLADRRRFRAVMANHRFGELRPDIWMRPANLPMPEPEPDWIATTGTLSGTDSGALRDRLWDVTAIRGRAQQLTSDLERLRRTLDWSDPTSIPPIFTSSAAVVRFLRTEPMLPEALVGGDWPVTELRRRYDAVEADLRALLREFLQRRHERLSR